MKLDEALLLLEVGAPGIKDVLKDMPSGDFRNLKEAYFKGDEGVFNYPRELKRLLDRFPRMDQGGEAHKLIQAELKVAEKAKKVWQDTKLGKYL